MQALATNPTDAAPSATALTVIRLLRESLAAMGDAPTLLKSRISRAYALLAAAHPHANDDGAGSARVQGGLAPWQVRRVKAYVEDHLDEAITVIDMAPVARLGPHYFSRAFKRTFGETPHAYVSRRRIEHSVHLMLSTDSPLAQIALDCGFADQAHFTRRFHETMGATPNSWRRQQADFGLQTVA
jgi:AraC-like DNA-binding protein